MPVQYQPYKSMYVSQRSPEISQMLRERYVQNFSMQDTLKQQLLELETTPFEGDQKAKQQLANEIQTKLNAMAERGDYENMTMEIAKTARQYQNKATPLMKNAELYKADKAEKEQLLQTGKISLSDYNGWLKKASMKYDPQSGDYTSYQGIEFDENGNVKQGSMYSSTPIAQFVDVQKEILTQLNALDYVKEGGYSVKEYQTIDGVEYAVEKDGQIVEYISPERVNQITQGVLSRPDVQSYMQQEAEFSVIDADENTLNNVLATTASKLRASGKTNEALSIENAINTGTVGQKRQLAQELKYNDRVNQYTNMGISTKAIRNAYGGGYGMQYSDKAVAAMKNKGETVYQPPMFYGEAEDIQSVLAGENGVVTQQSIKDSVTKAQNSAVTAAEVVQANIPEFQNVSVDELQGLLSDFSYEYLAALAAKTDSPGPVYRELSEAKAAIEAAEAIQTSANRASQMSYTNSEYTPESVSNYAMAEMATSLGVTADSISNQFLQLLQPGVDGFTPDVETAYQGIAENIMAQMRSRNVAPGGDIVSATSDALSKLTGMSVEEAEDYAINAMTNVMQTGTNQTVSFINLKSDSMAPPVSSTSVFEGMTPIDSGLKAFVDEFMDPYLDIATERSREYSNQLRENTSGKISFGETDYAVGASKEKTDDFVKAMKNRTLSDFAQARGTQGDTYLAQMFADQVGIDPEEVETINSMLQSYDVNKVAFTKGALANGQVESVLEITAKGPEDDTKKFKLRYNDLVASYPGFDREIFGYYGTSADRVTNNIYTQILASPAAAAKYGVEYEYNDPVKGNLSFKFVPLIGANNSIAGFSEISATGVINGASVSTRFNSLDDFYVMYNDLVAQ